MKNLLLQMNKIIIRFIAGDKIYPTFVFTTSESMNQSKNKLDPTK